MDHSEENHNVHVNGLCRLCGLRLLSRKEKDRGKKPYSSKKYADLIFLILNINIENDEQGTHSCFICIKCACRLNTIKKSRIESKRSIALRQAAESASIWTAYNPSKSINECATCERFVSFSLGSRHAKKAMDESLNADITIDTYSDLAVQISHTSHSAEESSLTNRSPEHQIKYPDLHSEIFVAKDDCDLPPEDDNVAHLMHLARALAGDFASDQAQTMSEEETVDNEYSLLNVAAEDNCQPDAPAMNQSMTSLLNSSDLTAFTEPLNESYVDEMVVEDTSDLNTPESSFLYEVIETGFIVPTDSCQPSSPENKQTTTFVSNISDPTYHTPTKKTVSSYTQVTPKKTPTPKKKLMSVSAVSPKLKIRQGNDSNIMKFRQKGRETTWIKVPSVTKSSDKVSAKTKRRRTAATRRFREMISGEKAEDDQQAHEIKTMKRDRQRNVLDKAKIRRSLKMSVKQALRMKERSGMTYHQLSIQKRQTKEEQKIPSIHNIRKYAKSIIKDHVEVGTKSFEEKTIRKGKPTVIKKINAVFTKIDDIKKYATQLLDSYHDAGLLKWDDGVIPSEHVWLKIGGDHGKGSFKVSLQVCNLDNANSNLNTHLLYMVGVKDTVNNLREIFLQIGDSINSLNGLAWRNKTIQLFFCGDYDFLLKTMGLSGATGTYPCLFCHAPKSSFKEPNWDYAPRSISTLSRDKKLFDEKGLGDKDNAATYNNVIREPLITTELSKISPPYLHIVLGLVLRHYKMLKTSLTSSDSVISRILADKLRPDLFEKYGRNWEKAIEVEDMITYWQTCVIFSEDKKKKNKKKTRQDKKKYQRKVKEAEEDLIMLKEGKDDVIGPLVSALDNCLTKNKIARQAFHGGSFTGNHCNKYIKRETQERIRDAIIEEASNITKDIQNIEIRTQICNAVHIHFELNSTFDLIHQTISHSKAITDKEIDLAENFIESYIQQIREHDRVVPKSHLLEHHVVPWLRKYKVGMGLHGEQGIEQLHSTTAKVEARCRGIRNDSDRLRHIMEAMIVHTSPILESDKPSTSKERI